MSILAKIKDASGNFVGDLQHRLAENMNPKWSENSYDLRELKKELAHRFGVGEFTFEWSRDHPGLFKETYLPEPLTIVVDKEYVRKLNHTFDLDELFFAYEQMQRAQEFEESEAERAAEFVNHFIILTTMNKNVKAGRTYNHYSSNGLYPIPHQLRISISYCQYDPYPSDILKALKERIGKNIEVIHDGDGTNTRGSYNRHSLSGINIHFTVFLLKLGAEEGFRPGTEYIVYFDEYDSHASGW